MWYDITAFAADFIKESNIAVNASYKGKINSKTFSSKRNFFVTCSRILYNLGYAKVL